jgi:hypothetical protein
MQPGPGDDDGSQSPPRASARWRRAALLSALVLGLCGLAVAAAGFASQMLPRQFTTAQQHRIEAWEVAGRWRILPEGKIFPAAVTYQLPGFALDGSKGLSLTARRLGVNSPARCAKGAGPKAGRILDHYGCTALLRATYIDSTGSMIATVGVAVLPSSSAAAAAEGRLANPKGGEPQTVRPSPVPGTLASRFGSAQRQLSWNTHTGPYVILTTIGYADGRPRVRVTDDIYLDQEMSNLAEGLGGASSGALGKTPPTPSCPGGPGC